MSGTCFAVTATAKSWTRNSQPTSICVLRTTWHAACRNRKRTATRGCASEISHWRRSARDAGVPRWLDALVLDLGYTLRALRNSRGLAALVFAILALGIGANTAIFTIANALILRSLPVKDPEQLHRVKLGNFMSWGYIEKDESFTYALWTEFNRRQDVFAEYFAYSDTHLDASLGSGMKQITGAFVTAEMFRTLGVDAIAGRTFSEDDERTATEAPVAVIGYGLWQREYGSDPAAIGRSILIEGKPLTIVGVLPPRFFGLTVGRMADIYIPLAAEPYLRGTDSAFPNAIRYWLHVFGRLRPDTAPEQARQRLAATSTVALQATLPSELPERIRPKYLQQRLLLEPGHAGVSYISPAFVQGPLAVLSGIVAMLLLLACFTVANLLLARATARQKEIAVRIALGASRARIARQLVLESTVLALLGGVAGILLARALSPLLLTIWFDPRDPVMLDLSLDRTVAGFALLAAVVSALVSGLAPALRAAQADPGESLKSGSATASGSVLLIRRALLAAQIAVAVVLVTGAVLFGARLRNLMAIDMGFHSDRILLAHVELRRNAIAKQQRQQSYERLLERMERVPFVESAALSYVTPISGRTWQFNVRAETDSGPRTLHSHFNAVSSGYLQTFGTGIVAGRGFTRNDRLGAPPVALVNSTLARAAFGPANPIGRRISALDPEPLTFEIVGVVQDAKYRSLRQTVPPVLYAPMAQFTEAPASVSLALRSRGRVVGLVPEVRRILKDEYPNVTAQLTTFSAQISDSIARERAFAALCTFFAVLALALAAMGVYGVLSFLIARRRSEIGIRIALGAEPADIRRLIYRQSFTTCLAGIAAGSAIALWGARFTRSMLYGLTPTEPAVYAATVAILAAVAVIATAVPALRASRTEPANVLRAE